MTRAQVGQQVVRAAEGDPAENAGRATRVLRPRQRFVGADIADSRGFGVGFGFSFGGGGTAVGGRAVKEEGRSALALGQGQVEGESCLSGMLVRARAVGEERAGEEIGGAYVEFCT